MDLQKADISDTTLQNESMNTKMLKGAQNQIKIVKVTSKLSHWDLRLTYDKQYINLQEYLDLDTDLRLQCNEQDNNLQEYSDLEADFRLKYNDQDNHLREYPDIGANMQEYAEEGNYFEEYSEEHNETNVEESILPELDTAQQHIKVKGEIIEELDSSDNLTQVKEEMFSDIDIDDSENDLTDFSDVIIRVKEELNESQPSESTYSTFDEINKHSIKQVEAIPKHFNKVDKVLKHYREANNSLKINKKMIDEVSKSSKLYAISGHEYSTFQCNVCLKAFLGDNAYNEHMKKHTTKDISSAEVIPFIRVAKIGNPLSDNWVMVKVKKFRVKRFANDKANENRTTKKYFTRSTDKVYDNDSKKSIDMNGDSSVTFDNDPLKVDNDSKVKVDEDYDNSTIKENKDLLIEIPGKTKDVNLPEGNKNHINVTYKVCNETCTNKKFCTQSKECLCKQRTKQDINTGFACTQCNYKGNQKHHLDRHIMLIHNRVKNFHCNLCDYKGVQQCHLDQHMRRHTGVKLFSCTRTKKYASRNSANNIVFSNVTQNKNYFNSVGDDNNVEVDNDSSNGKVDNNENRVTIDDDNVQVEVDSDNKSKVDDDNDSSTVKENKDLLIEIPGKTKVIKLTKGKRKLLKGKRKLPKKRTKTCNEHHNINVIYKVCDESCTNKQFCTQSKECRTKQRTKQDINTGFACTQCDYKGNQKHHLDRHVMLIHNKVKNFHCNLCDYKGVQQCHLDQHMRRHTGVKLFSCTRTKKYASRNSANNIVFSDVTQNKNYFNSVRDDNNVEVDNDSSTGKVDNNENRVTIDNDNVQVEVDNVNKFKVDDDNDSSTVKENKDLLIEIPGKTKVVKLPKGKRKLAEKRTKTCNEHHNINVIYKVCDESCTNKQFCTQSKECRRKQRTKQDINTCFACTQCDYKCNQKHYLDIHMLTHNRVKNFRCNLCNYKCVQQGHLDQHMRTHSKTKPYSCNFCDYNCVQRSQLDQHMRTHTGVKPFSCNICEYTCTQRGHLDQHMRRHTGIRPFSCIHCDYTCVQQSHLNNHTMKMHTNENIFECSHCGYRCLQLDMLVQHMNIH